MVWRVGSLESGALVVSGTALWRRTYIISFFRSKGGGMYQCPPYLLIFGLIDILLFSFSTRVNLSSIPPILPFISATYLEMLARTSMMFSEISPIGFALDMIPTKHNK